MSTAIIVASNRRDSILEFTEKWGIRESGLYRLFVIEDNEHKSFPLPECVRHYAREDIPSEMRGLVPVRTSGIKSFGIYLAYARGYDTFLVLDDDCLPSFAYPTMESLIHAHLAVLGRNVRLEEFENRCFLTLESDYARGYPDSEKFGRPVPVKVSVGSWCGVPDIDGRTQLWYEHRGLPFPAGKFRSQLVTHGVSYVFSGMHVCFDRSLAPYMYFFPTGERFFRYDDIWLGFLLKRLMDGFGFALQHSGDIFVLHSRQSNSARNHEMEGRNGGYEVNDRFYRAVRKTYAGEFHGVMDVFERVAREMNDPYFSGVLANYLLWIGLFTGKEAVSDSAPQPLSPEKTGKPEVLDPSAASVLSAASVTVTGTVPA